MNTASGFMTPSQLKNPRHIMMLAGAALLLVGCASQPREGEAAAMEPAELDVSSTGQELPSFYNHHNKAEAYGHCPKCGAWIKGSYRHWDGRDGVGSGWWGYCERCDLSLASEVGFFLPEPRLLQWKPEHPKEAQQRHASSSPSHE